MNMEGVSVIIPCLNESETISKSIQVALSAIKSLGLPGEVIVADNGSTDGSQEIARNAGAKVADVPIRGYGSAVHFGIREARYAYVTFADADLSYPFDEIPALIQPLLNDKADFVLGSRRPEKNAMPFLNRYVGTTVLSFLIRFFYGLPISDCNSGMRAFRKSIYDSLALRCPGMEYASEMLVRVAHKKLRYMEVPITFRKDQRSRRPHLRRWRDGWRHLRFIVANAGSAYIIFCPLAISLLLIGYAFFRSFDSTFNPGIAVHYHSAFVSLAMAIPLLLFVLSLLLIKYVLHQSNQVNSRLVAMIDKMENKNISMRVALGLFCLVLIHGVALLYHWSLSDWGLLNEMGIVIRIMIFTTVAALFVVLDLGLGILRLIPYDIPANNSNSPDDQS